MSKLVGLDKAARQSSGRSRKCGSCPLAEKLPIRCTTEISRICNESHIEGFKKGAAFTKKSRSETNIIKFFDKKYGREIMSRLEKLLEESQELTEAISCYEMGDNSLADIRDEMADVVAVIAHICDIIGTDTRELLKQAYEKVQGREKDPNYKRKHPHKEHGK